MTVCPCHVPPQDGVPSHNVEKYLLNIDTKLSDIITLLNKPAQEKSLSEAYLDPKTSSEQQDTPADHGASFQLNTGPLIESPSPHLQGIVSVAPSTSKSLPNFSVHDNSNASLNLTSESDFECSSPSNIPCQSPRLSLN